MKIFYNKKDMYVGSCKECPYVLKKVERNSIKNKKTKKWVNTTKTTIKCKKSGKKIKDLNIIPKFCPIKDKGED